MNEESGAYLPGPGTLNRNRGEDMPANVRLQRRNSINLRTAGGGSNLVEKLGLTPATPAGSLQGASASQAAASSLASASAF